VYVDSTAAVHTLFFDEFAPVGATLTRQPRLDQVHSIVFAIDLTNTLPGSTGRLRVSGAALER
jgi:hypothetical protein